MIYGSVMKHPKFSSFKLSSFIISYFLEVRSPRMTKVGPPLGVKKAEIRFWPSCTPLWRHCGRICFHAHSGCRLLSVPFGGGPESLIPCWLLAGDHSHALEAALISFHKAPSVSTAISGVPLPALSAQVLPTWLNLFVQEEPISFWGSPDEVRLAEDNRPGQCI